MSKATKEVIRIRFEKNKKFSLMNSCTDVDDAQVLAGSKIIINNKISSRLSPVEGDIFSCAKIRHRKKGNCWYGSGSIIKITTEKKKKSLYETLSEAPKPDGFIVDDDIWTLLLRNIFKGKHTVLVGPTGSGKSELVKHAAEILEFNYSAYNLGNAMDPRSKLIGSINLVMDESEKCNVTRFIESRFVTDIQRDKSVILMDEINRSNPEVNNIMLTLLDSQGYLEIDEHPDLPVVNKSKSCVLIGTANIGEEYIGTNILDRAFKDRVSIIEIDYLTKDQEKALLIERTGINAEDAEMVAGFAETCRGMWKAQEVYSPVSTRMTIEAGEMIADGFSFNKSIEASILPFFDDDGTASSDATKIKQALQKKG